MLPANTTWKSSSSSVDPAWRRRASHGPRGAAASRRWVDSAVPSSVVVQGITSDCRESGAASHRRPYDVELGARPRAPRYTVEHGANTFATCVCSGSAYAESSPTTASDRWAAEAPPAVAVAVA